MRTIGAIVVILLGALPALFAGFPGLAPGWFAGRAWGVPNSVLIMCVVMAIYVALAGLFAGAKAANTVEGEG